MTQERGSSISTAGVKTIAGIPLLPLKKKGSKNEFDIIDEGIMLYRPYCLYKNFGIRSPADRVLVYIILYINECIELISSKLPGVVEGKRLLKSHSIASFPIPGSPGFPLNNIYETPQKNDCEEKIRQYLSSIRMETSDRIAEKIYPDCSDSPSKWWLCFSRRKFMGLCGVGSGDK